MTYSDPISGMLVKIKNASLRRKEKVEVQASGIKEGIVKILKDYGYIKSYTIESQNNKHFIVITLRYIDDMPAIIQTKRLSKPSQRMYVQSKQLSKLKVVNELIIMSTPKGVLPLQKAIKENVGGEALCRIT